MNTLKFKKSAKVLDVVLHVLQIIALIAMCVAINMLLIITIVHMVNPDAFAGESLQQIDLGNMTVTLTEKFTPDVTDTLIYGWILLLVGAVNVAGIYYGLHCIRKILKPVAQGNPFYPTVGKDIRKLGVVYIVLGIVENAAGFLAALLQQHSVSSLLNSDLVSHVSVNYTIEGTSLVMAFVLFLLSYIFEYGVQLQQLSDETL